MDFAKTPPMGWNSWDCYGASVTEEETRKNAEYMARYLKEYGWEYVVVDIQWFEPTADSNEYHNGAKLVMDEYSRLLPAENRFPSAAGGKGFRPLSDFVHGLGLKFGIHILRGIPKQAVAENAKIYGSSATAREIANMDSTCSWNGDMYGVDSQRPGAQEYYDSILRLYADWGVDYLKVDDIARPYHKGEVELIRRAIDKTGREIVLSLSPGNAPLREAKHLCGHANMWRMSDDFWDQWKPLREMFDLCRDWFPYVGAGHWPDADMLPLGKIGIRSAGGARMTNFTKDEQKTMMSLWTIFRSPLMFGGDLTMNDGWTLELLQNREILRVLNHSHAGREVLRRGNEIVWAANDDNGTDFYLAQFNVGEAEETICTPLSYLGIEYECKVQELWENTAACVSGAVVSVIPPHGVAYYRVSPVK